MANEHDALRPRQESVAGLTSSPPHLMVTLVTEGDFDLGRMLDVFAEERGVRFAVFAERAEALTWLKENRPHANEGR